MTDPTPFNQGAFQQVVDVSWASAVVFVEVAFNLSGNSQPALPTVELVNMPYGKSWNVLDRVDELVPDAKKVPIVNPVNGAMLGAYYQWTPAPLFQKPNNSNFEPITIFWLRDDGNIYTNAAFDAAFGYPTAPEVTKDNYLDPFFDASGNVHGNVIENWGFPNFAGLSIGTGNIFDSAADAEDYLLQGQAALRAQYAAQGITGSIPTATVNSFVTSKGGTLSVVNGAAVFELGLNQLRKATIAKSPKAPITFSLRITVPDTGPGFSNTVSVNAQIYKKLRNFTLDEKNVPTFKPWGADATVTPKDGGAFASTGTGPGTVTIVGTIDPKTLNITFAT